MGNYAGRLRDSDGNEIVRGNDFDVIRTITDVPEGTTLTKAWLTIKQYETQLDAEAVLQKVITSVLTPGVGQITDTGADETASVIFQLTNANTLLLTAYMYFYDIKVLTASGVLRTVEKGTILPQNQITLATS